ncbi:F0F1 ATP synthase subunit A [Candidatus Gracilibacteria bacterium]|nr:F0F1 ATP synthase subunit A [Candidatus Gracilibacteria bacterium]
MIILDTTFSSVLTFYFSPIMTGVCILLCVFLFFAYLIEYHNRSKILFLFEYLYELVYQFYESIIGKSNTPWIKTYIVSLFFIIFIANIVGVVGDFIAPIFGFTTSGKFYLSEIFQVPSSDVHFNLALASVSVIVLLVTQFQSVGGKGFISHYFPVTGKGYMTLQKTSMKKMYFYMLAPFVKAFDIVVSLFLGMLDILGLFAKIVSLSFRLFGNIVSGGVLLTMMIVGISKFTEGFTSFSGGIAFPIILPLALYAQGLLVACIQAMVFALLVAIFIRVGQEERS